MSMEEDISWKSKGGARHLMLCFSPFFLNSVSSVSLNCTSNVFLIHWFIQQILIMHLLCAKHDFKHGSSVNKADWNLCFCVAYTIVDKKANTYRLPCAKCHSQRHAYFKLSNLCNHPTSYHIVFSRFSNERGETRRDLRNFPRSHSLLMLMVRLLFKLGQSFFRVHTL